MAAIELKVPDIGDFKDVEIIEVLVKAGDTISVEQSLITVESDKASMEIPASMAGKIVEMKVKIGDKVSEGSVIAMIEAAGAAAAPAAASETAKPSAPSAPPAAPAQAPSPAAPTAAPAVSSSASVSSSGPVGPAHVSPVDEANVVKPHASPAVRKFARELGVDLSKIRGSGPKQRITEDDVRGYVKGVIAAAGAPAA